MGRKAAVLALAAALGIGLAAARPAPASCPAPTLALTAQPFSGQASQPQREAPAAPAIRVTASEVLHLLPYLLIPVLAYALWRLLGHLAAEFGIGTVKPRNSAARSRPGRLRVIRGGGPTRERRARSRSR